MKKRRTEPKHVTGDVTDDVLLRAAKVLRAMGDARRLKLLGYLIACDATVTELATLSKMPMSTVSQHLGVMRDVRLVTLRREGKRHRYSIAASDVRMLFNLVASLRACAR